MKLLIVGSALVASSLAAWSAVPSAPAVVATAGDGQYVLSVSRLSDIIGNSKAALHVDVARQIATLWANYHLLGIAGSDNDSLQGKDVVDYALWAHMANVRYQRYRELIEKKWENEDNVSDSARYANGEILAARHILVPVDSAATPQARAAARALIDSVRRHLTPANFSQVASEMDVPGGSNLGVFGRSAMVREFEDELRKTVPGGISGVVQTQYGYHVIYRPRFEEIADGAVELGRELAYTDAENRYRERLDRDYRIRVADGAVERARRVGRGGGARDQSVLATYAGGTLTVSRFADWIEAFPPAAGMIPRVLRGPDSMVTSIVLRIARSEVELRLADSAGVRIDSTEMAGLKQQLLSEIGISWTPLGIAPAALAKAAPTRAERQRIAAQRVEEYFDRMVKEEAPYVDVPPVLARALRKRYTLSVDDRALDEVVRRASVVRATLDSVRSTFAPIPGSNPTLVPTPTGQQPRQPPIKPPGS